MIWLLIHFAHDAFPYDHIMGKTLGVVADYGS